MSRNLPTKLTPPQTTNAILRPRLTEKLARQSNITWISGLPGSGKTTLVGSYLEQRSLPFLWYRIDEGDSDIASFLHYLRIAFKAICSENIADPLRWRTRYEANPMGFGRHFFRSFFADLPRPSVLVFDGLHRLPDNAALHQMLATGLEELPDDVSCLITSCHGLPPAWVVLQARDQLQVIDQQQLQLSEAETRAIAEFRTGRTWPTETVHQLYFCTQGWVAGVVLLLARSEVIQHPVRPFHANYDTVFAYFVQSVWRTLEREIQTLLLQSALLPSMFAEDLEKLTGKADAINAVESLHKHNLFTSQLADGEYRYHCLFRQFLGAELERLAPAPELLALRRKAAQILLERGVVEESVGLIRQTRDWSQLARLVREQAPTLLEQGRNRTLIRWLAALPRSLLTQQPWLSYWFGKSCLFHDPRQARDHFARAIDGVRYREVKPGSLLLLSWSGMMDTFWLVHDDFHDADPWIGVLENEIKDPLEPCSPELNASVAATLLFTMFYRQPRNPALALWMQRGLDLLAEDISDIRRLKLANALCLCYQWAGSPAKIDLVPTILRTHTKKLPCCATEKLLALLLQIRRDWFFGDYEPALAGCEKGVEICSALNLDCLESKMLSFRIRILLGRGDTAAAGPFFDRVWALVEQGKFGQSSHFHNLAAWCALQQGRPGQALEHAEQALSHARAAGIPLYEALARLGLAYITLDDRDHRQAALHLEQFQLIQKAIPGQYLVCMGNLLQAYLSLEMQQPETSRHHLRQALGIGHKHGIFGFQWWLPAVMNRLCGEALKAGIEVDYVGKLIRSNRLLPGESNLMLERWPWRVGIRAMGRFELKLPGISTNNGKSRHRLMALLKALIAMGGQDVHQDTLTEYIWTDADGDTGRRTFDTTLCRLRKLLGDHDMLVLKEGHLSLNRDYCWLDIWALKAQLDTLEQDLQRLSAADIASRTESLFDLYRGALLANEPEHFWLITPRQRLQRRFLRVVNKIGDYHERCGELEQAAVCYQQALDRESLCESLYQHLIRIYHRRQQQAEAMLVYQQCRDALGSVDLVPSRETERLMV